MTGCLGGWLSYLGWHPSFAPWCSDGCLESTIVRPSCYPTRWDKNGARGWDPLEQKLLFLQWQEWGFLWGCLKVISCALFDFVEKVLVDRCR